MWDRPNSAIITPIEGEDGTLKVSDQDCHRRRLAAACGRYCAACDALLAENCDGCAYQLGETCEGTCPVFCCCVVERGLEHCGVCPDFACQVFLAHADPVTVARHYRALCRRTEIGTSAWLDEQERQRAHRP